MNSLINWKKTIPTFTRRQSPLHDLQHELEKVMSDFYSPFEAVRSSTKDVWENLLITPSIDIIDEAGSFKVEVEMPGVSEEDIKLTIDDNILTIKSEKKKSKENKDKNYIRRAICSGNYEANVSLPESVDTANAAASWGYTNSNTSFKGRASK